MYGRKIQSFWVLQKPDKMSHTPGTTARHKVLYVLICNVGTRSASTMQNGPLSARKLAHGQKNTLEPGCVSHLSRLTQSDGCDKYLPSCVVTGRTS